MGQQMHGSLLDWLQCGTGIWDCLYVPLLGKNNVKISSSFFKVKKSQ